MKDKILELIDSMEGSLLGIGIDDETLLEKIERNSKIDLCYILSNNGKEKGKKFKLFQKGRNKKINIKKLKKYFKKKSLDNVLCDYNAVKKFTRSFISGSIYINKGCLYIYGNIGDLKTLKEKYEKYTSKIKLLKNNKTFLLTINNKKTKSTVLKDAAYKILFFLSDSLDNLTEFLAN